MAVMHDNLEGGGVELTPVPGGMGHKSNFEQGSILSFDGGGNGSVSSRRTQHSHHSSLSSLQTDEGNSVVGNGNSGNDAGGNALDWGFMQDSSVRFKLVWDAAKFQRYEEQLATQRKGRVHRPPFKIIIISIFLSAVAIVIVYLALSGSSPSNGSSLEAREVCSSENVKECASGLEQQLKNDTTAALRVPAHYFFTFIAFLTTVFIFSFSVNRTAAARNNLLDSLPKDQVDLWQNSRAFNPDIQRNVNKNLAMSVLVKRLVPMTNVARPEDFARQNANSNTTGLYGSQLQGGRNQIGNATNYCSDKNWGIACNPKTKQMQFVNFKTVTVRSLMHITMLANLHGESFRINPWETVRDYLTRLRKQCPDIDTGKVDEFILLYEEARFHDGDFEADKWDKLSANVAYFDDFFMPRRGGR